MSDNSFAQILVYGVVNLSLSGPIVYCEPVKTLMWIGIYRRCSKQVEELG